MLDGRCAEFSGALPSESASSTAEIIAVEAVPFMADSALENASEIKGNLALVSRGKVSFQEKATRASEAGAVGIIVVNTGDELMVMEEDDEGFKSNIPVLMIKSSDAMRLREHGSALIRCECERSQSDDGFRSFELRAVRV